MTERITPDSTRRDQVPSQSIRLADGAFWGFLRPTDRFFPKVVTILDRLGRPVERVTIGIEHGYPLEVKRLIDDVQSACEIGSVQEQYEAFFTLAVCLLRRVHEISFAAACELLSVSQDELPRLVQEVMAFVADAESTPAVNPVEVPIVE